MMTTYIKDQSETSIITIKKLEDTKNKDIAQTFESINTWINDDNLDNELSNAFWTIHGQHP
jgi:DNA gyrase inhibitor GyrI